AIGHQGDTEGRRPVGRQVNADALGPDLPIGEPEQRDRGVQQGQGADQVDGELQMLPAAAEQDQRCGEQQRQQDGQEYQLISPEAQRRGSVPSTSTGPVRPREVSSSTRYRAVVAKPMTMAVSTRAWGTGSANSAASTACSRVSGGLFTHSRPMMKMNRLTA